MELAFTAKKYKTNFLLSNVIFRYFKKKYLNMSMYIFSAGILYDLHHTPEWKRNHFTPPWMLRVNEKNFTPLWNFKSQPAIACLKLTIEMFKVNNRNFTWSEISSKLTVKTPERRHWGSHCYFWIYLTPSLVFLLLPLFYLCWLGLAWISLWIHVNTL